MKCEQCNEAEADRETMVDGWERPQMLCGPCSRVALVVYVEERANGQSEETADADEIANDAQRTDDEDALGAI